MASAPGPSVFISYSHDSPEHKDRVLNLSDRLRGHGVDSTLDQYIQSPPEGWPKWMDDQVSRADYVLIVCTKRYFEKVSSREMTTGGKGVKWESLLTYQRIYDAHSLNDALIPVVFQGDDGNYIPVPLRGVTCYEVGKDPGYTDLLRRLTNQPRITKPAIGSKAVLPPRRAGEDDSVRGPEGNRDLVGDLPSFSGPGKGSPGTGVITDELTLEVDLVINKPIRSFSEEKRQALTRAIDELLELEGRLTIRRIREGSTIVTLELTPAQAERLQWAIAAGRLDEWDVIESRLLGARSRSRVLDIGLRGYAHPDVLVSTDWVAQHLKDPKVRLIESNEDITLYDTGHIPGAVKVDWTTDLNDPLVRDYIDRDRLQKLLRSKGINDDTTIVFYGDRNNWWAPYALWVLELFGLKNAKVMDGGRLRWVDEGRPLSTEVPSYPIGNITVEERDDTKIRAFRDEVLEHQKQKRQLVDVRSPEEFRGEKTHMPEYPQEGCLRGGHIPGAKNVPWSKAMDPETHAFRPASELQALYEGQHGLRSFEEVLVYSRIGERSAHTWFVLMHLLGFRRVRNYDGGWSEWGNAVGVPIERS